MVVLYLSWWLVVLLIRRPSGTTNWWVQLKEGRGGVIALLKSFLLCWGGIGTKNSTMDNQNLQFSLAVQQYAPSYCCVFPCLLSKRRDDSIVWYNASIHATSSSKIISYDCSFLPYRVLGAGTYAGLATEFISKNFILYSYTTNYCTVDDQTVYKTNG